MYNMALQTQNKKTPRQGWLASVIRRRRLTRSRLRPKLRSRSNGETRKIPAPTFVTLKSEGRVDVDGTFLEQRKFQHHQTWYRPHGTETHRVRNILTLVNTF
jgi:hypothetical protein